MQRHTLLLLAAMLLLTGSLLAQKSKTKFGKVDKDILEMTTYAADPEAEAVVLYDYGWVHYDYANYGEKGFRKHLDRHIRIKVLKESGKGYADFSFILIKSNSSSSEETMDNIKGFTFNLVDGREEKVKLEKEHIFYEKLTDTRTRCRITMPQVKVGSVIDLKYEEVSDFLFTIPTWYFEKTIPVEYSEYLVETPEYFIYKPNMQGYHFERMLVQDQSTKPGRISINSFERGNGGFSPTTTATNQTVEYRVDVRHFVVEDMPAFRPEPYSSAPHNYLTRLEYELTRTNFPNSINDNFSQTWDKVVATLKNDNEFGGQLNKANFVADKAGEWSSGAADNAAKMAAIYEGVKRDIKWNGQHRIFISQPIRKTLKDGAGTSADINLILLNALHAAGFTAYPMLISTRDNGYVNTYLPSLNQFDHCIVACQVDENWVLLDATHASVPLPLLPREDLNSQGLLITDNGYNWVDPRTGKESKQAAQMMVELAPDGQLSGSLKMRYTDYAATNVRADRYAEENDSDYWQTWMADNPHLKIESPTLTGIDDIYEEVEAEVQIVGSEAVTVVDDYMYISPVLLWSMDENPFKLEKREYPVDYPYQLNRLYSLQLALPDGYVVEELPENIRLALPEDGGSYVMSIRQTGNTVNILSKFNITRTLFVGDQYFGLREFYDRIVENHAAQIVLRKT